MNLEQRLAKVIREKIFDELEVEGSEAQHDAAINEAVSALIHEMQAKPKDGK